jgi:hypothetical protein
MKKNVSYKKFLKFITDEDVRKEFKEDYENNVKKAVENGELEVDFIVTDEIDNAIDACENCEFSYGEDLELEKRVFVVITADDGSGYYLTFNERIQ